MNKWVSEDLARHFGVTVPEWIRMSSTNRQYWTNAERAGLKELGRLFLMYHGDGEKYRAGEVALRIGICLFVRAARKEKDTSD
jgi:hypothetical protein